MSIFTTGKFGASVMQSLALTEEFASLGNRDSLPMVCSPISELCGSWVPKSKITLPSDTLPQFKARLGNLNRLTQYKIVEELERLLSGLVGGRFCVWSVAGK